MTTIAYDPEKLRAELIELVSIQLIAQYAYVTTVREWSLAERATDIVNQIMLGLVAYEIEEKAA